ncbi:PEP-CTERM sorting domain-containing protein [Psychromonas sp. 14N.309.X.WAT.B.A12]|uniref:PEP-CTERM sorting domain-containing protein n=1 Tax=unclassified Psychromonas TaxID=2614957 RepID=UPI0025B1FB4E|nr:PEP-CTERM sorting domain-containing protein [Psychromonas sp. 14N.309.X.WAT.B.A12]MDN2662378.1 PEP-CTERM sorting domain-containing protein [Psychromonas sp. 14N.309.X.WAT.B.A12]
MRKIISILVPLLFSVAAQATVMSHKTSGKHTSGNTIGSNTIGAVKTYQDSLYIYSIDGESDSKVSTFAGVEQGTFDSISTGNAVSGSAYQNSVTVDTGSVFSFDWLWYSAENSNSYYNDFAFVNLSLGDLNWLADTATPDWTTGSFEWTATESGLLTYTVGVLNVNDNAFKSKLIVNNFLVSAPVAVPAPAMLGLFALAVLGFSISRRKKVS